MENKQYLKLFENCRPVKGASRSIIYDLGRNEWCFIPNDLYDMLLMFDGKSYQDIAAYYGSENIETVHDYLQFLEEKEFIFYTDKDTLGYFPSLSLEWDFPGVISNAILDFDESSSKDIGNSLLQLETLGCYMVQLRFFYPVGLDVLEQMAGAFNDKDIKRVEIVMGYSVESSSDALKQLVLKYPRINSILVYGAPENSVAVTSDRSTFERIAYLKEHIASEAHCGVINYVSMLVNLSLFTEAQEHNTCLNRKIAVTKEGFIKNCPGMKQSYGHISDTSLSEAIGMPGFKDSWRIHKGQVQVCKDCEFRYACTDCRAYTEDPGNIYSKPLKCGYDPYTCKWEDWSENPLKFEAIKHYGMNLKQNILSY